MVLGKLAYMAPEHARGDVVERRADLFAVGVMLYELAAGERYWADFSMQQIWEVVGQGLHKPPRLALLPPEIRAVIEKATAPDAKDRYNTGAEMRAAISQVQLSRGFITPIPAGAAPVPLHVGYDPVSANEPSPGDLAPRPLPGLVDEVLFSGVARSGAWIRALHEGSSGLVLLPTGAVTAPTTACGAELVCTGTAATTGDGIGVAAGAVGGVQAGIELVPGGVVVRASLDAEDGVASLLLSAPNGSLQAVRTGRSVAFLKDGIEVGEAVLDPALPPSPVGVAIIVDGDGGARLLIDAPVSLCDNECRALRATTPMLSEATATVVVALEPVASPATVRDLTFIRRP